MKKILIAMLAVVMMLSMMACGKPADSPEDTPGTRARNHGR